MHECIVVEDRSNHLRGVALEVVVDVDSDAGVRPLVRARKSNLRRVGATAAGDLHLSTANVLRSKSMSKQKMSGLLVSLTN